jgi:uncharacterized Zn finger protein (UPF0148 family)
MLTRQHPLEQLQKSRADSAISAPCPTYLTAAQLRARLGQRHDPCPGCGSAVLAVLHSGEIVCPDCRRLDSRHRSIAFLAVLVGQPGTSVLADLADERRDVERRRQLELDRSKASRDPKIAEQLERDRLQSAGRGSILTGPSHTPMAGRWIVAVEEDGTWRLDRIERRQPKQLTNGNKDVTAALGRKE